jgi:hypothetical protein
LSIQYRILAFTTGRLILQEGPLIQFDTIPAGLNASIVYRNSPPFDSDSNYCGTENAFYVVTNVDPATGAFSEDLGFWDTKTLPNGRYFYKITATDQSGNSTSFETDVRIDN